VALNIEILWKMEMKKERKLNGKQGESSRRYAITGNCNHSLVNSLVNCYL
jgi:hypothetical protein